MMCLVVWSEFEGLGIFFFLSSNTRIQHDYPRGRRVGFTVSHLMPMLTSPN